MGSMLTPKKEMLSSSNKGRSVVLTCARTAAFFSIAADP
jgi:hypothetical protein